MARIKQMKTSKKGGPINQHKKMAMGQMPQTPKIPNPQKKK